MRVALQGQTLELDAGLGTICTSESSSDMREATGFCAAGAAADPTIRLQSQP